MADLIERTEEFIFAVNAGARAIESTKRYHGATYCLDVFSDKPKEIPYLKAAQILREFDELPTGDAVEVVRCGRPCRWLYDEPDDYCCMNHKGLAQITPDSFCSYGRRVEDNG